MLLPINGLLAELSLGYASATLKLTGKVLTFHGFFGFFEIFSWGHHGGQVV
jgi:hypothetical protein